MSDPLTIIQGDALLSLRKMESESVQCCVTSPPYWSLRDYGIESLVWDETVECEHDWTGIMRQAERYTGKKKWQHLANGRGEFQDEVASALGRDGEGKRRTVRDIDPNAWGHPQKSDTSICSICGAWKGCLGLEPTPELYVQHILQIFREVRRVLRKDGTLWLNLGDSYSGSGRGMNADGSTGKNGVKQQTNRGNNLDLHDKLVESGAIGRFWKAPPPGLKQKDLVGIPWMVAFALRADGWYLRSDIIWSKPNPMPESVNDRPTRSHEYVFLFSKSRTYYYDHEAVREKAGRTKPCGKNSRENVDRDPAHLRYGSGNKVRRIDDGSRSRLNTHIGSSVPWQDSGTGRNRRSVWSIATAPFPEAHFATFPPKLVQPCVLAGAPRGG